MEVADRAIRIIPKEELVAMAESFEQPDAVNVSLSVVWQATSGKQDARMSEISMAGCFIDCRVPGRALGDLVEFKVHLPTGPWVALQGELVDEQYPIGFGLRFTNLSEGDKRLLAQVVSAHGGNPNAEAESATTPVSSVNAGPPRILIADDDTLTLRMISAIAEAEGMRPVTASDGQQAFEMLQQDGNFDISVFDMTMPHMRGLDLIRFMKGDERLRSIPVGMITAERDPKIWDESVAAGACVFLPKPFTPPQVQMMFRMLMSKARQ
jgi:two-component system chemotaxis response regulator CheY